MLNKLFLNSLVRCTPIYYWFILIRHDMYRLNNDYTYLNFNFWYMLNIGYYEMVDENYENNIGVC